jgi:tRNA(fMet)-specific endonuclease VapC
MDNRRILADTSVIIEFLRKAHKENAWLWKLKETSTCFISSITLFELLSGAKTDKHVEDIHKITKWIETIEFDDEIATLAASIFRNLKQQNQLIDYRDIFIAATAKYHNLKLATLNMNHFKRIENLILLDFEQDDTD